MSIDDTAKLLEIKIKKNSYIQTKYDRECALLIIEMYKQHPRHYAKMIVSNKNSQKFKRLVEWVYCKTSFLDKISGFTFSFSTRLCWIFNGKNLNNINCKFQGCKKPINFKIQLKISDQFPVYCSSECANNDPETILKVKKTKKELYGSETFTNSEKSNQTFQKHAAEDSHFLERIREKTEKTNIKNGHSPNWNNREKAVKTFSDHRDSDPNFLKEKLRKDKHTRKTRYGDENFTNTEKARKTRSSKNGEGIWMSERQKSKMHETFKKNHDGKTSTFQLDGVKDKCAKSWLRNLGVDCPLKSKDVQKKIRKTNIKNFGVDHPWKSPEVIAKSVRTKVKKYGSSMRSHLKYSCDGQEFDSAWEVAFWTYCKDANIPIERAKVSFKFMSNGKEHTYFPDFLVNNQTLVEIKGDQFFNESGKMICPYKNSDWTDQKYNEVCQLYQDKFECMKANNVMILTGESIGPILDVVEQNHGKGFIKKFAVKK